MKVNVILAIQLGELRVYLTGGRGFKPRPDEQPGSEKKLVRS